jgi:ketosteroid isomerase-like protein
MPMRNAANEVRVVQAELGLALMRKDLDRAISLMTTDICLLGSKGPAVIGREDARRVYTDLFAKFDVSVTNARCYRGRCW